MSTEENVKELLIKQREQFALTSIDGPAAQLSFKNFDCFLSSLGAVSKRYYQALGNSIIRLRRYECSLMAWAALIDEANEETRRILTTDYIEPLLHVAGDLPLTIKDQLVHATVSFVTLSLEGGSLADVQSIRQGTWNKRLVALANKYPALDELKTGIDVLWASDEGRESKNRHGNIHHDVERNLLGGTPFAKALSDGLEVEGIEPPLDLDTEIAFIDERRIAAEKACALFADFASTLYL